MRRNSIAKIKAHICGECGEQFKGTECPKCGRKNSDKEKRNEV